jgi:hypothetical protein
MFLVKFNGVSYNLQVKWMSNVDLELDTDSAGGIGKGCDSYLQGKWAYLKFPIKEQ